jgi:hypothetical protein
MNRTTKRPLFALLCLFLLAVGSHAATAPDKIQLSPKGIYHEVDQYHRTGVKFHVQLQDGDDARRVPTNHPFTSGDRMSFVLEINRSSYLYVVNCTHRDGTGGDEWQPKRILRVPEVEVEVISEVQEPEEIEIEVVKKPKAEEPVCLAQSSSREVGPPRLLFPTYRAGSNNRLQSDVPYAIPNRGHYVMDEVTGTERLLIVLSDESLDLGEYFESSSGEIRSPAAARRLRRKLQEWKRNADVELNHSRGIVHEVDGYGVAIEASKPAVVEVDLMHGF